MARMGAVPPRCMPCRWPRERAHVACDLVVGEAQDQHAKGAEREVPGLVVLLLAEVHVAVHLDRELQRGAVEVDDVARDDVLATELPA